MGRWGVFLLGGILTAGCVRRSPAPLPAPPSVPQLLSENALTPADDLKAVEVYRAADMSFHLVRVRTREKPHRHDRHDLGVLVLKGSGELHVDGVRHEMREGDFFFVPRGTPHYFVNRGTDTAAAWVTFAPPFDTRDIVPVQTESAR